MINCTITTPDKTKVYDNIKLISLPTFYGQTQIMSGHAESYLMLKAGEIVLERESVQPEKITIKKGECFIKNNEAVIIL